MRVSVIKMMLFPLIALFVGLFAVGEAQAWTTVKPLNVARDGCGFGIIGGKFYLYGGYDGSALVNSLEVYDPSDPANNQWALVPQSSGVRDFTAAEMNGKLYMFGGHFGSLVIDNYEKSYDPATDDLETLTPRSPATAQANCVAYSTTVYGPELFVFGGAENDGSLAQSVLAYNPTQKTWRQVTSIPSSYLTGAPAMGQYGDTVYIMGGQTSSGQSSRIISYNIRTASWTTADLGTLYTPMRFPTGHVVPEVRGRFYLVGGNQTSAAFPSQVVQVYDPDIRLGWPLADILPEGLASHAVFLSGSDSLGYTIFAAGGINLQMERSDKVYMEGIDNGQGILPAQQAPADTDLNNNGVMDNLEPGRIKVVKTYSGDQLMGVELTDAPAGSSIETLQSIPSDAAASAPRTFPVGLGAFKIKVPNAEDRAIVTIRLSYDVPSNNIWYSWSFFTGWADFSSNVTRVNDHTFRVLLYDYLVGDGDNSDNGVICAVIGPSIPTPETVEDTVVILPSNGTCFINTILG